MGPVDKVTSAWNWLPSIS